jgi:hypothetical protein
MGIVRSLLALFLVFPAYADIQFTAEKMGGNAPRGKGHCDIRLLVDDAVEVSVQGDRIHVHNISGGDARDDGSECSEPLPDRDFEGFQFSVKEKRNEMRLTEPPSLRNGYRAVIFIRDSAPGEGRYVFRLSWKQPPPPPPPGMSFNNAVHSALAGHGEARMDDRPTLALTKASVDFDNGGNIFVIFEPAQGAPMAFRGTVMSWEGGVMKADTAADERFDHLRGPMYLYFDGKKQVFKIELKATDGQQHLALQWESGKAPKVQSKR